MRPVLAFRRATVVCLLLLLSVATAHAVVAVPPLTGRVLDLTTTLSTSQRIHLEQLLRDFEARKGSQVAILMLPTTGSESIEEYAIQVVDNWKLGRKGVDDGVLLLVALDDHALRIEVGYGLEGVIPDAVAKRVIAEVITPYFKRGDFFGGIEAGVQQIVRLIDGEALPPPAQRDPSWSRIEDFIPLAFMAIFVFGAVFRAIFGRLIGASVAASIVAGLFWLMMGSLIASVFVGFIALLFVLADAGQRQRYWGWPGSGFGGSGGFGGRIGNDSGGFSGGGGSFGGGGASGRW